MWVETQSSAQHSFQKLNVDNCRQKTRKIRYYIVKACPILLHLFNLCQIFCPRFQILVPSLPSKNKTLVIVAKSYSEIDTKYFGPFRFCLIYLLCPINFFRHFRHFLCNLSQPSVFNTFIFFISLTQI